MPGLTRKCREGESFRVGEATVHVVRTGRKAVINIVAPPEMRIEYIPHATTDSTGPVRGHERRTTY